MPLLASPVRIALFSDIHISLGGGAEAFEFAERLSGAIGAIGAINQADVDIALFGGDLTESGTIEEITSARQSLTRIQAPICMVAGNHDIGNKLIPGRSDQVSMLALAIYESHVAPSFYSKPSCGLRVIGINTSILGSGLQREQDQWEFLEDQLLERAPEPTIILSHYPLYIEDQDEASSYWNVDPDPRSRMLGLIEAGGVLAVLSGHTHHPNLVRYRSTLLITAPAVAFGLPKGRQPEGWTLVTIMPDGQVIAEHQYL